VVGYGAGTTGGAGGRVYTVSSFAEFKAAVEASGPRIVQVVGDRDLDGAGQRVSVRDGNLTIDGSAWSGELTRYSLVLRASNIIITQMRLRPGDQIADVGEGDGLTINPRSGSAVSHVVIDHCSLLWAPDVTLAILNRSSDITIQYSILGASLYYSANPSSPNGYGPNVTTTGSVDPSQYGQRITFYRNYLPHNHRRNLRAQGTDGIEWVNNVIYDWGDKAADGNPRGANAVGNMFKKGSQTEASGGLWDSELFSVYSSFFSNSVYWADNIGLGFTPTTDFVAGVRRATPYGGGLHYVVAAPASSALAAQVVAGAGPAFQDGVDARLKTDFGSGSGTFYNGSGYPAPNPS
jgi:pectate lyase